MTELNKSRNKHTRGPWRHQQGYNNVFTTSDPENGVGSTIVIATVLASQVAGGADEADANARRIVACVNACEGIDTSLLEQLRFPLSVLHRRELELLAQRDELLMALQLVVANTSDGEMLNKMARAAIARVEGGAT